MVLFVFIMGVILGSFANVCIHRIPQEKSIVFPSSFCPRCGKSIKYYDNIPIVSFLLLKGKCRFCKQNISYCYPFVEFITAVGCVWLFLKFGVELKFFISVFFLWVLIVISVIDFYHQIIPDQLSFLLIISGLLISFLNPFLENIFLFYPAWAVKYNVFLGKTISSFLGFILGGGILYSIAMLGEIIFKREVMGGGDVKLLAGLGAFLGIAKVFDVLLFACVTGSIIGFFLRSIGKNKKWEPIPFGPFLCAGAIFFLTKN